jgi:N,N'-diacetyllegionaminate synthase
VQTSFKNVLPSDFSLVAEIGPNHNGSLKQAFILMDEAANAGCNAVKFQYRDAKYELFDKETRSYYFDQPRYEFIRQIQEFSVKEHQQIRKHAEFLGLRYIASAMCREVVERIVDLNPYALKIPSGEFDNFLLHEECAKFGEKVILSTGMTTSEQIDGVVDFFERDKLTILHCMSEYPTDIRDMNLLWIREIIQRYGCAAGLSDHSRRFHQVALTPALGGNMIEFHFTLDRDAIGPDHHISLLPHEVRELVELLKLNISALGDGRKRLGEHATEMRETFGNSICAIRALKAGDIIKIEDLCLMKPRTGIAPHDLSKLLGATVISPIETRQPITWNCLKLKANE